MGNALTIHDQRTRAAIEDANGAWVKHTGDGALAAFTDPADAVTAAAAIQRALADAPWPSDPLHVRIGIHTGHAALREGDYHGLAVSATARVADAGHGGQVLVSAATAALLTALPNGVSLTDLGPHRLKDLEAAQHIHQLVVDGLPNSFPPLRTLETVDHNLPLQLTSFVGREAELAELRNLVLDHRLVTLTGVGGAGKTRLSLQAAAELSGRFPDGVRLVELAPTSDPEMVPTAFATALGVRFEEGSPVAITDRLLETVQSRRMLMVVDNCEHVLASSAALIQSVLSQSPEVHVLASSREALGLPGERIWQTPSLGLSPDGGESEAVTLFMERAQAVAPALELNPDTRPHIERICRLLDGVPLAIELAASRARVLRPDQIADRLGDRFRLLTGGARTALPRQQTLEAAVDWSYQLLTADERLLFERLSVFRGGFTLETVEGICSDDRIDVAMVLDLLTGLADKSMIITVETGSGVARFGMLETLRQYAERKLLDGGEAATWKDRHAKWFGDWASQLEWLHLDSNSPLASVRPETENLDTAFAWASPKDPRSLHLAESLARFRLEASGDFASVIAISSSALSNHEPPKATKAHLLALKGRAEAFSGLTNEAHTTLLAAAEAIDESLDDTAAVQLLRIIGRGFGQHLDPEIGVTMAARAMDRSADSSPEVQALAHYEMGWAQVWAGGSPEAVLAPARRALELARAAGRRDIEVRVSSTMLLASMALDAIDGGDRTRAVEDEILQVFRPGDSLGWGEEWIGIRRAEWAIVDQALSGEEPRGATRFAKLVPLGTMHWMRGDLERARDLLEEADALGPAGRWHHDFYPVWAEVSCLRGDLEGTRRVVNAHLRFRLRDDEQAMKLATWRALVQAEVDAGSLEAAQAAVQQMESTLRDHPLRMGASVQLGTPEGYLACARAELTRLTGPDPDAWAQARRMTVWEYWRSYCEARRVEALAALGRPAVDELAAVRARAEALDFRWIVGLLDSLA